MTTWLRWLSGAPTTVKPDDRRNVATMLGPCRVTIQEGRFHCFCKAGVCVHSSTTTDLGALCSTCGHSLREHEDVPGSISSLCFIIFHGIHAYMTSAFKIIHLIQSTRFPRPNKNRLPPFLLFPLRNLQTQGSQV